MSEERLMFFIDITLEISRKHTSTNSTFAKAIAYLHSQTIQSEFQPVDKMSLGMLVRTRDDYEYFADYVRDNRIGGYQGC